jgi:Fe-S-cluster-containing dehydrogenase component
MAFLLHQETADLVLASASADDGRPSINDGDICLYCRRHQCIAVCPTAALSTRADGRVDLDSRRCIGCGACVVSCYEFANLAWRRSDQLPA